MSEFDHHNGKAVKAVSNHDDRATITFEDGSVIDVPVSVEENLVGQALLMVEDDKLVFGIPKRDGEAIRQAEILTVASNATTENENDDLPVEDASESRSKDDNA